MISLRCDNNKKAGEIDAASLAFVVRCRTCSDVWGRPVYHKWPIGKVLEAIGRGQVDGVVYPEGELPVGADR
jgi:hypothetical protein